MSDPKVVKVHDAFKKMSDEELKEYFKQKLSMDPKWARRALQALYDEQTQAERDDPINVHESNGRGFSPADQEFLTSLARQAQTGSLSMKQLGWLYQLLPKYAGQLVKFTRENEKLEPSFTFITYFARVSLSNARKELTALTGELDLDPRFMPRSIVVRSPEGDEESKMYFTMHETVTFEGLPSAFIYNSSQEKNKLWKLIITVGEPDALPEWAEDLNKMLTQKGRKKSG